MTILTPKECNYLLPDQANMFQSERELCAGMKHDFPKYMVFNREFVKKKKGQKIYKFKLEGTKIDKVIVQLPENFQFI